MNPLHFSMPYEPNWVLKAGNAVFGPKAAMLLLFNNMQTTKWRFVIFDQMSVWRNLIIFILCDGKTRYCFFMYKSAF